MTTGPFGVEVVSKVNPFKAKKQVASQLKLVGQTKPKSFTMRTKETGTNRDMLKVTRPGQPDTGFFDGAVPKKPRAL
jgi:hypothetical protein